MEDSRIVLHPLLPGLANWCNQLKDLHSHFSHLFSWKQFNQEFQTIHIVSIFVWILYPLDKNRKTLNIQGKQPNLLEVNMGLKVANTKN